MQKRTFCKGDLFIKFINTYNFSTLTTTPIYLIGKCDSLRFVSRGIKPKSKIQKTILLNQLWFGNNNIASVI